MTIGRSSIPQQVRYPAKNKPAPKPVKPKPVYPQKR